MRFRIKSRLLDLRKTQMDLLNELRNRSITINSPSELSRIANGRVLTPKANMIAELCDTILTEWESQTSTNK